MHLRAPKISKFSRGAAPRTESLRRHQDRSCWLVSMPPHFFLLPTPPTPLSSLVYTLHALKPQQACSYSMLKPDISLNFPKTVTISLKVATVTMILITQTQ